MPRDNSKRVDCTCRTCGKSFSLARSQVALGQGTFCSRACQHKPRPLIPHPTLPGCLIVTLTKGKVAIIDDADAAIVAPYSWSVMWNGHRWYARRGDRVVGKHVYMHRAVLGLPDGLDGDHMNGDSLDNRRSNLRPATQAQNMANRGKQSNNPTGFKGVRKHPTNGLYRAYITFKYKRETIGWYATPEEAARAYDARARVLHGEFAVLNFP